MRKRILLTCLLISFPLISSAAIRPVVTVSAGGAKANVYSSESILFGAYPNSYIGTNHYDSEFDGGVFFGVEAELQHNWALQVGLSYFMNNSFAAMGNVYQFGDPAYNNLSYQYQILSRRVSIDSKLSYAYRQKWHPYVTASVGKAYNSAYSYTESPATSFDEPMTQPFTSHSTTSFTYAVGLGFDYDVSEHMRFGVGYRFVNLGDASLGTSPLQTGSNTLSNSQIHANELLAQFSYLG